MYRIDYILCSKEALHVELKPLDLVFTVGHANFGYFSFLLQLPNPLKIHSQVLGGPLEQGRFFNIMELQQ